MPESFILDIYYNNKIPSFKQARDAGLRAVIHKCTQGTAFADPLYTMRKEEVTSLGMLFGAYHFGVKGHAVEQADFFLQHAGDVHFLALDWESNSLDYPASMPLADAEAFVQHIYDKLGRWPVLYTGLYMIRDLIGDKKPTVLHNCPLWLNNGYQSTITTPKGWDKWTLWQWTNGRLGPTPHTLPGLGANDLNLFNGNLEELNAFFRRDESASGDTSNGN